MEIFQDRGSTFPAGGKFGEKIEIELIDRTGSGTTISKQLPTADTAESFQLTSDDFGYEFPTALPFRLSPLDSELESTDTDSADLQFSSAPVAFDGIINTPEDVDFFGFRFPASSFDASAIRCCVEVFADRIGSPIDSKLRIFDSRGHPVASNDDWGSHDSRVEFRATVGSDYVVEISDKLNGGTPNSVYRVEVTTTIPTVTAFLPRPDRVSQDAQTISIASGNRVLKRVGVRREYVEGEANTEIY